jgi:hypothetical protein
MKGKTVEVAPFASFTYFLVNRYTKERFSSFESILDAKTYAGRFYCDWWGERFGDTYNLSKEERDAYLMYRICIKYDDNKNRLRNLRRPFLIVNQYGDIVSLSDIWDAGRKPYRNHGWEDRCKKRNTIESNLVKCKGDGNKIKSDWAYRESWNNYSQEVDYTNDSFGYFRRISTTAERRANLGCDADYGQGFVRGARSYRNIPNSWDDVNCGAYGLSACWKHNSKRRKQWKPK